jgi:hypothetical protein
VIYNGSFFYYNHLTESIVQYQLNTKFSKKIRIPRNRVVDFAGGELLTRLYQPQQERGERNWLYYFGNGGMDTFNFVLLTVI